MNYARESGGFGPPDGEQSEGHQKELPETRFRPESSQIFQGRAAPLKRSPIVTPIGPRGRPAEDESPV